MTAMLIFSATNYFFPQPEKNIAPSGVVCDFIIDSCQVCPHGDE
jgi:hypothetical protein